MPGLRRAVALLVCGRYPMSEKAKVVAVVALVIAGAIVFWCCSGVYLSKTGWH